MRAKKRFGQNFLKDPFILDQIVQVSAELLQDQKLIEIGVGLGDLSERLYLLQVLRLMRLMPICVLLFCRNFHHAVLLTLFL